MYPDAGGTNCIWNVAIGLTTGCYILNDKFKTRNSIVLLLSSTDMLTLRLDPDYQSLRRNVVKISRFEKCVLSRA
jgi:hypothetical protein